MKKIELNNEIVLLRQIVRQARIRVVNKLVREAKKLRSNHGNEKQLEKNKHKVEKLLREVFALKRIKDDEISRFGIINFENLQDIFGNSHTDDGTRAMVKVVRYKPLTSGIINIREKFPNYNEYILWNRRKRPVRKKGNVTTDFSKESSKEVKIDRNNATVEVHKERAKDTDVLPCVTPVPNKKNKKSNEKYGKLLKEDLNKEYKVDKGNATEIPGIHITDVPSENSQALKVTTKVISNEATVKRFVEILQETKVEEKRSCLQEIETQEFFNKTIEFTREMDDFFLYANNAPTFSSIPMSYVKEDTENVSNVDCDAFKSGRIRSKKGKLYNEKKGKTNWNKRMQEMNNKNDFNNGDSTTTETSIAYWKENRRKYAKGKERSTKGTIVGENESLHPSWAAKRKQQDILKQGFQGKKIKFEED